MARSALALVTPTTPPAKPKAGKANRVLSLAIDLAQQRLALRNQIKQLETQLHDIDVALMPLAVDAGDVIEASGVKITVVRQNTSFLDRERLLELGVKATVLEKATVTKPKKPFIKVTAAREEE